jgi:hypothetical protein
MNIVLDHMKQILQLCMESMAVEQEAASERRGTLPSK